MAKNHSQKQHTRNYNLLIVAIAFIAAAYIGYHLLRQSSASDFALIGDGQTNAISAASSNASTARTVGDTDLAGLLAAERGQLGEPALVWFHADW